MQRAVFLYNPQSGSQRERRLAHVEAAAKVFRDAGIAVTLLATEAARTAGLQARAAVEKGCDAIIACGGDGTVHDVLQGMVGLADRAVLGVIPLGTANALANDLRLPMNPRAAAETLLKAQPRRIAVGQIDFTNSDGIRKSSYFSVTAGVGVDAELLYKLALGFKQRWGLLSYYIEAFHQWKIQKFPRFQVEFLDPSTHQERTEVLTQLLAVRISHFGGVLKQLAPDASLLHPSFQLVMFKTSSRARYLRFVLGRLFGWHKPITGVEIIRAERVCCRFLPETQVTLSHRGLRIHTEADGEALGVLPAEISILPDALNLLVPLNARCLS